MQRTRGLIDLVFDLVDETTDLVERTHEEAVERWSRRIAFIKPVKRAAGAIADLQTGVASGVCKSIRLINGVTRWSVGAVADLVEPGLGRTFGSENVEHATLLHLAGTGRASRYLDHLQAALNGVGGEYLRRTNPRLALRMTLRHLGQPLPMEPEGLAQVYSRPTSKICVFVHGLASTEHSWSLFSQEHYGNSGVTLGSRLGTDLGFTPIYLRYDTSRQICENGQALAKLLTEVLRAYPVPVEEIALVGHSMGGLVARSAAHSADKNGEPWLAHLRNVVCLAAPHHGAPLEKALKLLAPALESVQAAGTQVPARLLARRSDGIKDLGYSHAAATESARSDRHEVPSDDRRNLPHVEGVSYHFLAATIGRRAVGPLSRLFGDLLVTVPSASGKSRDPARRIPFASETVLAAMNHFGILNHPRVHDTLSDLLAVQGESPIQA